MEQIRAQFIVPMLCLAVTDLPEGLEWEYELKLDGYRAIGLKARGRVLLLSRNGKDFTRRFQPLARALAALPDDTVIDGESLLSTRPDYHSSTCYRTTPAVDLRP